MNLFQHTFSDTAVTLPIDAILPTRQLPQRGFKSQKYLAVRSSIEEIGVVEPLVVFPEQVAGTSARPQRYILLDGHLRLDVLKALGHTDVLCLVATVDEGFTYNRQLNRLSAIQEHRMIRAALDRGVPIARIAKVLSLSERQILERDSMLDGIAPEAVELLKDHMVTDRIFPILRRMAAIRQIEAAEMMVAANCFTRPYAEMLLLTTKPEQLVAAKPRRRKKHVSPEDLARIEAEIAQLQEASQATQDEVGETMLQLVVSTKYLQRLLANQEVRSYLWRHHAELMEGVSSVIDAIGADERISTLE